MTRSPRRAGLGVLSPRRAPNLGKIRRRPKFRLIPLPGPGDALLSPCMISHPLAYVAPKPRQRDVSSFLIQQGGGEVDGDPAARRRDGGSSGDLGRASPSSARGRGVTGGRGRRQGLGVLLPCASPLYIGVEGAGFLPSKSIGALAKVGGGRNPIISLPHRLLSPLFRDLDLIPSGYDLIPSKRGSWCALTSPILATGKCSGIFGIVPGRF